MTKKLNSKYDFTITEKKQIDETIDEYLELVDIFDDFNNIGESIFEDNKTYVMLSKKDISNLNKYIKNLIKINKSLEEENKDLLKKSYHDDVIITRLKNVLKEDNK